jgi:nucleoside 2-deoxyribosyltransferase
MVCGSIGYNRRRGAHDIKDMYIFLQSKGFSIVDHMVREEEGMDYSDIMDFRDKPDLSRKIVEYDLEYVKKADVIVVIANEPSYGTAIEVFFAKKSGKKVILLAKDPVPTPWPINFSDYIVNDEDQLIELLHQLQNQ